MKIILLISLFIFNLMANDCDKEQLFWNEIKDSKDIEDYKYYNKKYPNGTYEYLANKYINQLRESDNTITLIEDEPNWIDGESLKFKFYGVGKAIKHFNGIEYQKKLSLKRAMADLDDRLEDSTLDKEKINELKNLIKSKEYVDSNGDFYLLIYIENYEI
ncbi:MAG: hypothetical protein U9R39_04805 [Campylobacterota bacterium]|nr:hypothetical protein [Campylobacterota bacterium]